MDSPKSAQPQSETARVAGRYRIEKELARGGMGAVYAAFDESTEQRVALKRLLDPSRASIVTLFEREYYTLAQLRHPRIIEVYDYGIDEQGAYYTMELLDGDDLRELAPLPAERACAYLRDVASSLALLHARRLLHRDISPRNVRVTATGRAKLIDFGALTTFGINNQVVGTAPGVSPEALHGLELDQRSDLYALGALGYWLLTGRHAYAARDLRMLPAMWRSGTPDFPSSYAEGISVELDELIMSLLSVDAFSRPATAASVIDRLISIAGLEAEETVEVGSSYLVNPKLVGRDRQLDRLTTSVEGVVRGRNASVVVSGSSGSGKTRLLAEGSLDAQLKGALVLRADAEAHQGPYAVANALAQAMMTQSPDVVRDSIGARAPILVHVIPKLLELLQGVEPAKLPQDRAEQRLLVQDALLEWWLAASRLQPLLLVVDNAHLADESTLALLNVVVRRALGQRLGVWASLREGDPIDAPRLVTNLQSSAQIIDLRPLDTEKTTELVACLFGEVEHTGRLGRWLHDHAGGNPGQTIYLARHLVDEGAIAYRDGAWLLPGEYDDALGGAHGILQRQVEELSPDARLLAENLSVESVALDLEQCLVLAGTSHNDTFIALTELVSRGVLVAAGDEYRFGHRALREHLLEHLDGARRKQLHLAVARLLLDRSSDDPVVRIRAGWHLMHGGREVDAALHFANAAANLLYSAEGLRFAAPALEAALDVYDRRKESPYVIAQILAGLTAAGWYVDPSYAYRYGTRCLEIGLSISGLSGARAVHRSLGPALGQLATLPSLGVAAVRHALQKPEIRTGVMESFLTGTTTPLTTALSVISGVAATVQDGPAARDLIDRTRFLGRGPKKNVLTVLFNYARYYALAAEGRLEDATPYALGVLEWLAGPDARKVLDEGMNKALAGGMITGFAHFRAFRDDSDALEWAEKLETTGMRVHAMSAAEVRFSHHVLRGELDKARPHREKLELLALQVGMTWQSSVVVPLMLAELHSRTGDTLGLRQATDALEQRARDLPALTPIVASMRAQWHWLRGRHQQALSVLEGVTDRLVPFCNSDWVSFMTTHARALLGVGRAQEARAAITQARSALGQIPDGYAFLYLDLDLVDSEIDCAQQQAEQATARLDALIDRYARLDTPLTLARLHDARARVALQQGDFEAFETHHHAFGARARRLENSALLARYKRLDALGQRQFGREAHSRRTASLGPRSDTFASAAKSLLESKDAAERAPAALRLAVERSGAQGGFLYIERESELELAASEPAHILPPGGMTENLRLILDDLSNADVDTATATIGTFLATDTPDTGGLHTELLIVEPAGSRVVVGMLALKPPADDALVPLSPDVLQVIALSLYGSKFADSGTFESETGDLSLYKEN